MRRSWSMAKAVATPRHWISAMCSFGYALAKVRGLPLLFKGDDFPRTEVQPAVERAAG